MPGIDLKQMWSTLRPKLEAICKSFDVWLVSPFAVVQRGLVSSGILSPASTQGALGFLWTVFVWFAALPVLALAYLAGLALASPFIVALLVWWLVKWPFTLLQPKPKPKPTPAPPVQPAGFPLMDTLATIPPGGSRLQYLWRIPLAIVLIPLMAFLWELAQSLFLWLILFGFGMWVLLILGILSLFGTLFGFGVMIGRDDATAGINSFTTVCNYRNLTQRDMISMTFDAREARDAFSCPWIRKITVPREGITKVE